MPTQKCLTFGYTTDKKLIVLKKPNLLLRVLNQEWTASAFIRDALFCLHLEGRANMHRVLLGEKG